MIFMKNITPRRRGLKNKQKFYLFIRSVLDFTFALIALTVLFPVFIATALAVKFDSKGPVFFRQKRIGKNGKIFTCVKFRSMTQNAEHDVATYRYDNAQSFITRTGKFIRKTSIDELPQLFNVLAGKMSLIGYRPALPCETELNARREEYGVYSVKPGITGWAQINGRDVLAANPEKKAAFDAFYVQNISVFFDIKIFFMTFAKVFKGSDVKEGAAATEILCETKTETPTAITAIVPSGENNEKSAV